MTKLEFFFYLFLVANTISVGISMVITRRYLSSPYAWDTAEDNTFFLCLYFSLMKYLEFYSVAKFCFLMQIEGIFQLVPLKILHYFFVFLFIYIKNTRYWAITYIAFDLIFFWFSRKALDEAFAEIYHEYNIRIGCDFNLRNAFILRNVHAMSKYNVLVLNMMIIFEMLTYSLYSKYYFYNMIRLIFFSLEGAITHIGNKEIYSRKYVSLVIYTFFSIIGVIHILVILLRTNGEKCLTCIVNELNTIVSTIFNYLDFAWYGNGLDNNVYSSKIRFI